MKARIAIAILIALLFTSCATLKKGTCAILPLEDCPQEEPER